MTLESLQIERKKMARHEYRGFTIESYGSGLHIVVYGKKHKLFVSGTKTLDMSIHAPKARTFRTTEAAREMIDGIVDEHEQWVKSLKQKMSERNRMDQLLEKNNV